MKHFKKIALIAFMFAMFATNSVHAAGERFIIGDTSISDDVNNKLSAFFVILNSNGSINNYGQSEYSSLGINSDDSLRTAMVNSVVSWANSNGFSGVVSDDVLVSAKPKLATVATSGLFSDIASKPTTMAGYGITDGASSSRTFNSTTRSLNASFQVSSTKDAIVSYTVDVATTLSLTGGATGTVFLEIANDSGFTSGVQTIQSAVNGNTGALTIGLSLTQTATATVSGVIPTGKYVRLRTANTAGTPTFTYRAAQEVLF